MADPSPSARPPSRAPASRALLSLLAAALAGSCSPPAPPRPAWRGALCEARVPGATVFEPRPPRLEVPTSRVTVDVRVDTLAIVAELEKAVPRRVAERRGMGLGPAGKLSFAVDRGSFGLGLEGDELSVGLDLEGSAELCKPLSLLGCVPYASCRPAAHARAAVGLLLDPGYRLAPSRVDIPITRRCTLTALEIDVTGEVQSEANRYAAAMRQRIDSGLPELGGPIASLWKALGTSVPVGVGACARVLPTAVVQSGPRVRQGAITLGLGAEGEVLVESPCKPPRPSPPLPPPRLDRGLEPGVDLQVPLLLSWEEVGRAVSRSLALLEPEAGSEVLHVTDVRAGPGPAGGLRLGVTFAGRVCGEAAFDARGGQSKAGDALVLEGVRPAPGEAERARAIAPGLDLEALSAVIERSVRIGVPVDVPAIPRRIDRIAAALLGPTQEPGDGPLWPEVSVAMKGAQVERVTASAEGLSAVVHARGEATVRVRARAGAGVASAPRQREGG